MLYLVNGYLLPQVSGEETDFADFADFKCAVWHESFKILLGTIAAYAITGHLVKCGDGMWRRIYPFVFVLAADYEEQYV